MTPHPQHDLRCRRRTRSARRWLSARGRASSAKNLAHSGRKEPECIRNVSDRVHIRAPHSHMADCQTVSRSLQERSALEWGSQVKLVYSDMRSFYPREKADIIVSELLGSFGDNELSPECLDGVMRTLKREFLSLLADGTSTRGN